MGWDGMGLKKIEGGIDGWMDGWIGEEGGSCDIHVYCIEKVPLPM